jgi:hypothetical protein
MKLKVVLVSTDSEINNDNLSELNQIIQFCSCCFVEFQFKLLILTLFSLSYSYR